MYKRQVLHLGRRGAAARCRPPLAGALRRRDPRRHRLDRDAAHLHLELSGRGEVRHDRQARARLRHPPGRRRRRCDQDAGRDGRAAGARAHLGDHVLERPRAVAQHVPGRVDPLGRQIRRGRDWLLRLLRTARRHAQGRRHLRLAVRGGRRAIDPSGGAGGCGRRLARRRRADQAQGLRGAQGRGQGLRGALRRAQGARQGTARAVQISALDRISCRVAEDRDRQDPALQVAGGIAVRPRAIHCSRICVESYL